MKIRYNRGMTLKKIIPLLILTLVFTGSFLIEGCHKKDGVALSNFVILDSLLQHEDEFHLRQLTRAAEIKQKRRNAVTLEDKYLYDNLLFETYYILNADSALKYADSCIASAELSGNNDWITHSMINKSNLLAATGLLKEALDVADDIDPSSLSNHQLVDYYGQMIYLYSHLGNYIGGGENDYYVTERLYRDSIMNVITPSHPEYLWYKGWSVLGKNENPDSIISALKESLEHSDLNERKDAKNAYVLARLYDYKGDKNNFKNYMALSAIVDVKIANSEISSLEDLATLMFDNGNGDTDRAYRYINYSLNKALNYPNRTKAFGIAKTLDVINSVYQEKLHKQRQRTTVFLVLLCVISGILIVAFIAIILQNKKVSRQRKDVDEANNQLHQKVVALSEAEDKLHSMNQQLIDLNADLKVKNKELNEANFVKEEYIGYVFNLCSNYIARIEDFKRNVYLKILKKQYKEIEKETSDLDRKEEVKEFYHSFDTIFLNLYPNFVSDFNSLLKPDKQISLKEGELLNMELRIYALVRLGITDSVKIADFLHCAPQTVYNYRLRARSRALYPKDDFIERVKKLGNFLGKD